MVPRRQGRLQLPGLRVRVQPQIGCFDPDRPQDAGGGRIGGLIGVQFDIPALMGLFARHIGHQLTQRTAEET